MRYFSTRSDGTERLSFEDAVLTGLAPDGGLYIPERIPSLPQDWQTTWANFSFQQLSVEVLSLFISSSEIARSELQELVNRSYATFRHPDVTPLVRLDPEQKTQILELFHGPTFAFKDVALQLLGNLFEFFLARRNARSADVRHRLTVLGATSGDTGSAAIYGLRGKKDIDIFILHPKGRVSEVQEAQMTTVPDANVHNLAVKGTFDDCQDIVKHLFADAPFNYKHKLGAINSINWARILAQTVYYFHAYFAARKQLPENSDVELQFVVPTGNFGDILAGYYAKRMGVPMTRLSVATNANDILARFWATGRYEKVASHEPGVAAAAPADGASDGKQATADASGVKETLSPAMDILVSSNFERLLWYLALEAQDNDAAAAGADLRAWMASVKADGRAVVPTKVFELARRDFIAERVSDEQTLETIAEVYAATKYVADPHTAVALCAAKRITASNAANVRQIVLSTAHPAKFSDAVTRALSSVSAFNFDRDVLPDEFKGLLELPRRVTDVEAPRPELVKEAMERALARRPAAVEEGASV